MFLCWPQALYPHPEANGGAVDAAIPRGTIVALAGAAACPRQYMPLGHVGYSGHSVGVLREVYMTDLGSRKEQDQEEANETRRRRNAIAVGERGGGQ